MDDYNSKFTGPEIDAAIDRAKAGGAIDKALQNNDPRQWGLGKDAKFISNTDLDTLFDSGFYTTGTGCTNVPVGTDQNWSGLFVMGGRACTQIYRPADRESSYFGSFESLLIRIYKGGNEWQPWEWVNPPMFIETEYRTTERHMGKPVYVKLLDFGALPNATMKEKDTKISIAYSIIDRAVYSINPGGYEIVDMNRFELEDRFNKGSASWTYRVISTSDYSAYTKTYVTFKYTKD